MIHETGHLLGAGRNDDGSIAGVVPQEVYSGNSDDDTLEIATIGGVETDRWSVMVSGNRNEFTDPPISGDYIPFSIEEILTIEFNEIETRAK